MTDWTLHGKAWRIPSADGSDYGVLVECGPDDRPYWWLLCPATATLYVGDDPDLTGCHDGASCNWIDVHSAANDLRRAIDNVRPRARSAT